MSASKITNYFEKMAQSDQRMVKNTVAGTESQGATSFSSEQHTKTNVRESADDWSLRPTDLSLGTDNIEKQPVIIDLDSQEDSDDEEDTGGIPDNRVNSRKVCRIHESSDSEADVEDLSLQSPLKAKRKFIIDNDDSDEGASVSLPKAIHRKTNSGHNDSEVILVKNQTQQSLDKDLSDFLSFSRGQGHSNSSSDEELNHSRKTRKRRLMSRNRISDVDSTVHIDISSDDSQGSIVETRPSRQPKTAHNVNSGDSDNDSEDWDVDKAAILDERTRTRKQSRYSEVLARMKTRKGKGRDIPNEGAPEGPMDRFTQRQSGYGTHENRNWVQEESDDDSDDQDDFVVDDDIIDGEKTNKSTAPVELPAEFSTRYQDDTEGHFRTYFEYLMRKSQDPSLRNFHNLDTRFQVAISSVQRLLETCKDKIYTSVWKPEFVEDLSYWPSMSFKPLREYDHDCDACQISGKGSTCSITFYGSGYDENYMPLQHGERARSRANIQENEVENHMWLSYADDRPKKDLYWVGSTCFYRARVYHGLVHLQHDLSVELRAFVDSIFETLNQDDNAIAISDQNMDYVTKRMDDTGLSDKLWSMARTRVNDALHFRTDRMPIDGSAFLWT